MSKHKVTIYKPEDSFSSDEDSNSEANDSSSRDSSSRDSSSRDSPSREIVKSAVQVSKATVTKSLPSLQTLPLLFPERTLMLGASGTGKTTLIRSLIRRYIDSGKLITKDTRSVFWFGASVEEEGLPKGHAFKTVSESRIAAIRAMMKQFPNKYCIVVLDDVLGENFHGNKFWADFISSSRHERIIVLIGLQYVNGISPTMRNNLSRIFVTSTNNSTRKALYALSNNPSQSDFFSQLAAVRLGNPALVDFSPTADKEITVITVDKKESI